jgi:hypothetical protein
MTAGKEECPMLTENATSLPLGFSKERPPHELGDELSSKY